MLFSHHLWQFLFLHTVSVESQKQAIQFESYLYFSFVYLALKLSLAVYRDPKSAVLYCIVAENIAI